MRMDTSLSNLTALEDPYKQKLNQRNNDHLKIREEHDVTDTRSTKSAFMKNQSIGNFSITPVFLNGA